MQINSNYSMNGVPCETRRKQDNINPYMAEADFDEKAFGMILLRMKE